MCAFVEIAELVADTVRDSNLLSAVTEVVAGSNLLSAVEIADVVRVACTDAELLSGEDGEDVVWRALGEKNEEAETEGEKVRVLGTRRSQAGMRSGAPSNELS